mgnify:CR=1 FL=1
MSNQNLSILVFDVETTGTKKDYDQIIELSVQQGLGDDEPRKTWRFKPSVPISPGAQQVHGISMDDLADCEPFSKVAEKIHRGFAKADVIVGYNVNFDLEMLQAEFQRAGLLSIDLTKKLIVDPLRLWQEMEPRSLGDAHRRFVGIEFEDAHSAEADIAATARVLNGMLTDFNLKDRSLEELADLCEPERRNWIGPSRHFQWKEGVPIIGFGKHAGTPLHELIDGPEAGYLEWMMSKDFPEHVTRICAHALRNGGKKLIDWIIAEFGPPSGKVE